MPVCDRPRNAVRRALLVLAVCLLARPAWGADTEAADKKLYQTLLPSTVWVNLIKKTEPSGRVEFYSGTGALVDLKSRLVLTNYHVVRDKERAVVLFPAFQGDHLIRDRNYYTSHLLKGSIPGKVIARDLQHDLALIELDAVPHGAKAIHLASQSVRPGERIHSLGNPGESDQLWVFHTGAVQRVIHEKVHSKTIDGFEHDVDARLIITDSPTKPGESGGPLVNEKGELAGITHGHALTKTAQKEIDTGVFIEMSEIRSFLESKQVLARVPPIPQVIETTSAKPKVLAEPVPVQPTEVPEDVEQTAARRLRLAKSLVDDGKVERGIERYRDIIRQFPTTKAAAEAKQLLGKLNQQVNQD